MVNVFNISTIGWNYFTATLEKGSKFLFVYQIL